MYDSFEDEPPCIHHRSQFDTEPAPPPAPSPSEPRLLVFPAADVKPAKPTRAELVLSAQQWAAAVRENLEDIGQFDGGMNSGLKGKLYRLDAILAELAKR